METITFKIQEDIIKKIDAMIKPLHFSNRTEFIRESIREKLNQIENDFFMQELIKFKGAAKKKVSNIELADIRKKVSNKYAEKFNVKL